MNRLLGTSLRLGITLRVARRETAIPRRPGAFVNVGEAPIVDASRSCCESGPAFMAHQAPTTGWRRLATQIPGHVDAQVAHPVSNFHVGDAHARDSAPAPAQGTVISSRSATCSVFITGSMAAMSMPVAASQVLQLLLGGGCSGATHCLTSLDCVGCWKERYPARKHIKKPLTRVFSYCSYAAILYRFGQNTMIRGRAERRKNARIRCVTSAANT